MCGLSFAQNYLEGQVWVRSLVSPRGDSCRHSEHVVSERRKGAGSTLHHGLL